ncbi:MAG: M20/M25/M40 family metallo-hydrolase [Acidimicrobiales bacterium]
MTDIERVWAAIDERFERYVEQLTELCRLRSRREEPEGMLATADYLERLLDTLGADVQAVEVGGAYPYLLADIGTGPKTLLNFNHYDVEVEPPGPDELWTTPPYEPSIRDGKFFARGVADDKAALLSRIHACDAFKDAGLEVPVRVKFLLEGKRNLGAPALADLIEQHADWLSADGALWENSWSDFDGRPLLKFGEKGILYLELHLRSIDRALTSQNAALLPQAAASVARAAASLTETVDGAHIPGFQDGIETWSPAAQKGLQELPFDPEFLIGRAGAAARSRIESEPNPSAAIRTKPTIVLSWLHAGPPAGSVALGVPAEAAAGIEIRLVPGQTTAEVLEVVTQFLKERGLGEIAITVRRIGEPELTSPEGSFAQVVIDTARVAYAAEPILEPTTVWIGTRSLVAAGGMPIVGVGIGRPDCSVDGPNEHILLEDYRLALRHLTLLMHRLGSS